jgi:ribonuclease HI
MINIFTDGSCKGNGKKDSTARFAILINNKVIRGVVEPYTYQTINLSLLKDINIKPSNNRGELLGLIYALLETAKNEIPTIYNIYSDSLISVKTVNEWYPKRKKKNTTNELKNIDLIEILMELINSTIHKIIIKHTLAHKTSPKDITSQEYDIWLGNNLVDKYASQVFDTYQEFLLPN